MTKYEWNLEDIYPNMDLYEDDIKNLEQNTDELEALKGHLGESSDIVLKCYNLICKGAEIEEKLFTYASLKYHKDMSNQDSIRLTKRMENIAALRANRLSFITPEMGKIDDDILRKYLGENAGLQEFKKAIEDLIKAKKHILSLEVEEALTRYSEVFGVESSIYDIITNTEFDFPDIKDENGDSLKVTHGTYSKYLMSKDQNIRKQAFESMYSLYKRHENSITEMCLTNIKGSSISSKMRHYESCLDAVTDGDDSNIGVVDTLIEQVDKYLYLNHDYISWKKKALNLDEMHLYDVYVNPLDEEAALVDYEDGKKLVLEALSPMGKAYTDMIQKAMDENWIDVFETPNKMTGGYATGVYGVHPYVLLNYMGTIHDVSTIAHELGHAMHFYYANTTQNIINSNYTIMVAEVASTVNEILLANYLINKEQDPKKKASLINDQLDTIRATLYRQAMFTEFERKMHELVDQGEGLSANDIHEIYYNLVKKYFGPDCVIDDLIKYEWERIPHFYSPFYVYKYATGITSAIVIASNILNGTPGYVEKYINMLSKGGSEGSLDLLKSVDVDLEKPETYEVAFKYFEKWLNELKSL